MPNLQQGTIPAQSNIPDADYKDIRWWWFTKRENGEITIA